MKKCSGCGCDLDDDNTNYSEFTCDECYEEDENDEEEFDGDDP